MLAKPLARYLAARGIHYGWAMVVLTFLTMLATAAGMGMPGVLITPLEKQFGWDAATVSGPLAMRLLLFGLMAPFSAALLQRFGVKRTILAALVLIVCGLLAARSITHVWQLWAAWGLALGIGSGVGGVVFGTTVATRWFAHRRGLIIGMLTASNATGQLVFLPLAARLADLYGWPAALVPAAIACSVMAVMLLLFAVERPADLGLPLYGETTVSAVPPRPVGNFVAVAFGNLASASRVPAFWLLVGTFFVCGWSTNGLVQTHFIPLCEDFGMTAVAGATVLTMMGACDFVGTIGSGWLSDRINPRTLLFFYYGMRGVSLLILPFLPFSVYGLSLFAVFYGLDWIATAPATVRLAADVFGRERAPMIFGWVFAGHQIGSATVALGAGVSRDILQTYVPAFESAGLACLAAALAFVIVRVVPARQNSVVLAERA
jgi:MFS family permease